MAKFGLALSGGGFRATLFHLGVVRFLRDAGLLGEITDIASVSGGSVLAAHLALNWDRYNGDDEAFAGVAGEIVNFVRFDVRNHIVRRLPLLALPRFLSKLTPWRTRGAAANAVFERYYTTQLYGDRCLYELPESPRLHILATNVSNGGLSVFNRDGLYIQQRPDSGATEFEFVPGKLASIPKVVAASSAFPGFFPPVEITAADLGIREGQFPTQWFTDGGVYDNLGLRGFSWLKQQKVEFDRILVGDAGKPFQVLTHAGLGLIAQSVRASDILSDRVWQLERENFFGAGSEFVFIAMTDIVDLQEDPTALHPVVQTEVQSIRTDLDRFSPSEINALVMHGYEVARKVYRSHVPAGAASIRDLPPWVPLPAGETPRQAAENTSSPPAPTTVLARRLRRSSNRRVFSTLLDPRDWPSYVYVALALLLFVYAPYQVYQLHRRAQAQALVIDSITRGDPDLHMIFGLLNADPIAHWIDDTIVERPAPTAVDTSTVEVLTRSRILDFRSVGLPGIFAGPRGSLYIRERLTVKLSEEERAKRRLTLRYPNLPREVHFRRSSLPFPRTIALVSAPSKADGPPRPLYEVAYDLGSTSPAEPVTIELEAMIPATALGLTRSETRGSHGFETDLKTDLASVWVLFPTAHPYRSYQLVRYPVDGSAPPETMHSRFTIDHPYGRLIGWSMVNAQPDTIYECRWLLRP